MAVTIKKESGKVTSTEGLPIGYSLFYPYKSSGFLQPVLFVHGFKGFKDWGPFPEACMDLASEGLAVVAVNLSHNGVGDNPYELDRPDLFESQTFSQDLQDIQTVVEAIRDGGIAVNGVELDGEEVGIIGHSRGGHTAVIASAEIEPIQVLITWAAVADAKSHWSPDMIQNWQQKGFTEVVNARTGQMMRIGRSLYDDVMQQPERLSAVERVKKLHIPCCFIHGKQDEAVPVANVYDLYNACPSKDKRKVVISQTGHTFGAAHPHEQEEYPEKFEELLEHTRHWLRVHLLQNESF